MCRPEHSGAMHPEPDYGEKTYHGSGKLTGKRALITGGDSGIGRAVALAYQMSVDGLAGISTEQLDRVLKTNVYAMFWLCKAALQPS